MRVFTLKDGYLERYRFFIVLSTLIDKTHASCCFYLISS